MYIYISGNPVFLFLDVFPISGKNKQPLIISFQVSWSQATIYNAGGHWFIILEAQM